MNFAVESGRLAGAPSWARPALGWGVAILIVLLILLAVRKISQNYVQVLEHAAGKPLHPNVDDDGYPTVTPRRQDQPSLHRLETETADISAVLADDIVALRSLFDTQLDGYDDVRLANALNGHNDVVYLARDVGWNDPEIREQLVAVLSPQLGRTLR